MRDEAPAPTTEPEETDPSSWRILANAECNSMVSFYEAPFRQRGRGLRAGQRRVNHIGGECRAGKKATRLRLFVNGKVVRSYRDPDGFRNFRRVGLAVFAPEGGLEVMFDNAKATELRASGSG